MSGPHLDIRTMHIIEKGYWEEMFIISECGHVHMKLQFVLSEEERTRIRLMRESVMKKKLEENPSINLRLSEIHSDSAETPRENDQASDSATSSAILLGPQGGTGLGPAISDTTDYSGHDSGKSVSPPRHERAQIESQPLPIIRPIMEEGSSISDSAAISSRDDHSQESGNRTRPKKIPSNVQKIISAFESSQIQETKLKKIPSVNRLRMEGLLENPEPKAVADPADESMRQFKNHSALTLHQTPTTVSAKAIIVATNEAHEESPSTATLNTSEGRCLVVPTSVEMGKSPMMQTTSHTGPGSSRTAEAQSQVTRAYKRVSDSDTKSLKHCQEECSSTLSSGTWVLFPDDTRHLCITTAGEQIMKPISHHSNEATSYQTQNISPESKVERDVMHGTENNIEMNRKETADLPESEHRSSPEGSSKGLAAKVIKIAATLGFGLLVVLTRQKEPRKKQNREEDDNLFSILQYVKEGK